MSDQRIPISQLSETQTAPDASYIAIDDGSLTKKITVENFNSTSTASAQQYANQAAASAQTVEDNIATSAAQIREATLAAREATQASTSATASATSAYDSASLAQNYSANASTSAGQAMNAADSAAQNLTASKGYAEDSEAWAVGKRNGSDVPASDETYQNNAKYYADSASGSATRAEAAAQSITVPDTTLTVSGVAAESKATGDRISSVNAELADVRVMSDGITAATAGDAVRTQITDVKRQLNELVQSAEVTASGSGNKYVNYAIKSGHVYKVTITSSASTSVATVDANNQSIQSIPPVSPGTAVKSTFTATADAPKVLFYFRASGTARVEDISLRVPVLESEMASAQESIAVLDAANENFKAYNEEINRVYVSAPNSGNYYIPYEIKAGHVYKFTTTCPTNSVTVFTANASNVSVETIGTLISGTHSTVFIAGVDAPKAGFYFRAAGHGSVIELSTESQQWLGEKWSCYGDSLSWNYGWQPIVCDLLGFKDWVRNGKPGAQISWVNATFGINANGIYTTDSPVDTVHESLCAYDRIAKTIDNTLPLIFVMGGTNDFLSGVALGAVEYDSTRTTDSAWNAASGLGDYDITTVKGAMASMFMKLQYHAPNALIVFGTLCNGIGNTTGENQYAESVNSASLKPSDYARAEKEVCETFGIPCVDVFGACGINITNRAAYITDTVHPNEAGNKLLARCVASGLRAEFPR